MGSATSRLRARAQRVILLLVSASLLLTLLSYVTTADSAALQGDTSQPIALQTDCPEGFVLSDNGVTCDLAPVQTTPCPEGQELDGAGLFCIAIGADDPGSVCSDGQRLDPTGLFCEEIPDDPDLPCPVGEKLDGAGLLCIADEDFEPEEGEVSLCDVGYSLGADGETCIIDSLCDRDEIVGNDGECRKSFRCPDGQILSSDLITCTTSNCPDEEILSIDGRRCVAADTDCPDGSPRPIGGACLVVEKIENEDGTTEVVVRCAEADVFCQARVKQCADERAAGEGDLGEECADPRGSCDAEEEECQASNDRLVECATRESEDSDGDSEAVAIGGADDPCDDLCPELHRLDASGECVEFLNPKHPCVSFGRTPAGVTTNAELDGYSYLAGTGQCVTKQEFLRRLGNFEAAAGAEADALSLLRETTSSYLSVEEQLAELDQMLIDAERDIRTFTADAAEADALRADNEKLLLFSQKELARERALLKEEVLQVFVLGDNDARVEAAVLTATNVTEIGVARVYGSALLDEQVADIGRIERLESQSEELAVTLEQAAEQVEQSLTAAVESAEGLESLRFEATVLRAQQLERRNDEAELVAELRETKAEVAQELGVFEQATREITDIIADTEYRVTVFAEFEGLLANPIFPETRISSGFGPRVHPILGYVRNHNGVDISAGFGEEILASGPGVVQIASNFGGYGNTVVVDHGSDLLTLYAHMSVILVEPGDEIELGQTLGLVGSTGLSTGPHLHFEVWENGDQAVDPRPYLSDAG